MNEQVGDHVRGLEGQVAIVTGAARGLGYGIARSLAERGARLVLNDLDHGALEDAAASLGSLADGAQLVAGDISSIVGVEQLVREAEALQGHVDILVNNAGVQVFKGFLEHSVEEWDRVVAINLRGVFLCTRAVAPGMIRSGGGRIVNLASIAAFHTTTPHDAYAASKAAVVAFTRDVAYELAPYGIRVNAVAPGPIETPMTALLSEDAREAVARGVPLARWGRLADVGSAVAFLVSGDSDFVTGITLPVAGGSDLRLAY